MHTIAVQLAPILAAEKSKTPFYIAGGLLVAWALALSLGIGTRRPDFPRSLQEQRGVMGITAVLVIAALVTAVATSGGSVAKSVAAQTTSTSTESPASPTATTGTPTPPSSPAAGGSSVSLAADPAGALAYDTKQLSAKAGTVTITMANASPVEHDVAIAQGTKVIGSIPGFIGGSKTFKLTLKPGKYTFYCTIPGHRVAGMEGTLTVS
jgi:plastocyanin